MSQTLTALSAAAPVAAGWSVHSLWVRHRIEQARRDPLTGLHTRAAFEKRAARLLHGSSPCAVVVIGLDDFKDINDAFGHATGDLVIQGAGYGLAEWNNDSAHGTVARLGGDEFAACFPCPDPDRARLTLSGLHGLLTAPLRCHGHDVTVGASIGAAWTPTGEPLSAALRWADEAMYTAKRRGGGVELTDRPTTARGTVNGRRDGRQGTHRPLDGGAR
jgi:diguanylate cyclase (GGDEF)-like protein